MKYTFKCDKCGRTDLVTASSPPLLVRCPCGEPMVHDLMADLRTVTIDTSACRDHDEVPEQHRIAPQDGVKISPSKREALYQREIQQKRAQLRDGGNRGDLKQTHSIPAELYHGKIKETGDRNYWKDKKNLKRHKSTEVAT